VLAQHRAQTTLSLQPALFPTSSSYFRSNVGGSVRQTKAIEGSLADIPYVEQVAVALRADAPASPQVAITVDYTHVGRRVSGIERITAEQFNETALRPLKVRTYRASEQRLSIMLAQMIGLPLHASKNPADVYIFPGFPPSPYFALHRDRCVLFVHDLFLLTRRPDLNCVGKYYMAPMFYIAVKKFRYFLTNSEETANKLRVYCDPAAMIVPYRPYVRNVFALTIEDRAARSADPETLRIMSIGTVEPRKNFVEAAKIREALARRLNRQVELHIIGRLGWGPDPSYLRDQPNVILHGYLDDATARSVIAASDLLLCTSHDEGLCLPLIEVQYSGMPVVAPDKGVFREALGSSGILFEPGSPAQAADQIADAIAVPSWRSKYAAVSTANVARWNAIARADRAEVISFLSSLPLRSAASSV